MRRKNYITIADDPNFVGPPIYVPPADFPSSTDTTNNNKGDFWKTLANIAGGLFSNKNNQPQQMDIPQNPPKNKPNYGLIIGIIVAAIVVGVAIYFMTRK